MTELERAQGGRDILDKINLSRRAYKWLSSEYDPKSMKRIEITQKIVEELFEGQNVEISQMIPNLDDDYTDSARISVRGEHLYITNTKQFADIRTICDSVSFVPGLGNVVMIDFYISNVFRKIERGS